MTENIEAIDNYQPSSAKAQSTRCSTRSRAEVVKRGEVREPALEGLCPDRAGKGTSEGQDR